MLSWRRNPWQLRVPIWVLLTRAELPRRPGAAWGCWDSTMGSIRAAARQSLVPFSFLTNPRVYLGVRLAWLGRVGSFCWWCTEATASSPFWGRENVVVLRQGNGNVHHNCPLDIIILWLWHRPLQLYNEISMEGAGKWCVLASCANDIASFC